MFEIINETEEKINELKEVEQLFKKVVKQEKLSNALFNVIIVDNNCIQEINKKYRNIDAPTDVISFALEDNKDIEMEVRILGDIYISIDKVYEQALNYHHSILRELSFLAIHGLLHLLGYDHMNKEDEIIMFKKQEEILNEAGIKK